MLAPPHKLEEVVEADVAARVGVERREAALDDIRRPCVPQLRLERAVELHVVDEELRVCVLVEEATVTDSNRQ